MEEFKCISNEQSRRLDFETLNDEQQKILRSLENLDKDTLRELITTQIEKAGAPPEIIERFIALYEIEIVEPSESDPNYSLPAWYSPSLHKIFLNAGTLTNGALLVAENTVREELEATQAVKEISPGRRVILDLTGKTIEDWNYEQLQAELGPDNPAIHKLQQAFIHILTCEKVIHEELHALTTSGPGRERQVGIKTSDRKSTGLNEAITEMIASELSESYLRSFPPDGVSTADIEYLQTRGGAYLPDRVVTEQYMALLATVTGVALETVKGSFYREYFTNGSITKTVIDDLKELASTINPEYELEDPSLLDDVFSLMQTLQADRLEPDGASEGPLRSLIDRLPTEKQELMRSRLADIFAKYKPRLVRELQYREED